MAEWILIVSLSAGLLAFAKTIDSVALVAIPGFKTEEDCKAAGEQAKRLETLTKTADYVCVKQVR